MIAERDPSRVDASLLWRGMPEAIARESRGVARLRNLSTPFRTSLALAGLASLAMAVWLVFGRTDRSALPHVQFWLRWLPGALLTAYTTRSLLWPEHRRAPAAWLPSALLLASVALSLAPALLPELHRNHPASLGGTGNDLVAHAFVCSAIGMLFGGMCLAWVALFVQGSRGLGAISASAWALFVFGQSALSALHCPLTAPLHLALGHGAPGLIVLVFVSALHSRSALAATSKPFG